jgi:hypothetical protein
MTTATNEQHFTEEEAQALKRKFVQAKTSELSVAIGSFGKITMVDKYGIGYDKDGKFIPAWEVGIKWDTDDEDEEPIYDWFIRKDEFNEHIEIVSKQQYKRGNVFTQEEASTLIGKRVKAKRTYNSGLLKKGAVGTVTGVSKHTSSNGNVTWQVEITWDTKTDRYLQQFPRAWFLRDIEVLETSVL